MTFQKDLRRPLLVGTAVGVLAALGFLAGVLNSWSSRATDRLFLSREPDPSITVIAIDNASITQLGRWPWPRQVHAELIAKIAAAGARVIAYDVNFPEVSDEANDEALAKSLRVAGNVVLPVELELNETSGALGYDAAKTLAPIPSLASAAKATGHSNTPPDEDSVVRRIPLYVLSPDGSSVPSFVAEAARVAGLEARIGRAPVDSLNRFWINYPGSPMRAFRTIPAIDVIRGTADLSALKGGAVFVGATAPDLHDTLQVPTSDGTLMPGVEIHASAFDTIASERWLRQFPKILTVLFLIFIGFLVGLVASNLRSRWTIPLLFVLWVATIVLGLVMFDRGFVIELIWPTLTFIFAYSAVTLERRMHSDRARRELKTAFSRYVSPSVVEEIMKNPAKLKLGGERRTMTVMFSDIRGFTTISEGMGPDQLVHVLNIYLDRMTEIVFKHQGVLDKYIGDAVMAFWNAPLDQPDHAYRAALTVLEMRDALDEMNRTEAFGKGMELHIGLGVNSGDMVVGNVGGQARFDYTVIGDNVNLGSRLEGLTKEYGVHIIVSEATAKEIRDKVLVRRIDKVAVKGKKEPVLICEAMELMEKATEAQKELAKAFEAALEKYFAKNFTGSLADAEALLKTYPNDGPSKLLKERSEHFLANSPPPEWVGTWVYTKK